MRKLSRVSLPLIKFFTILTLLSVSSLTLFGQSTARLTGNLVDPTDSVVPNVKVVCVNTNTGLTQQTVTNEDGGFIFPELPIGKYELRIAQEGFQTLVRRDIELITGQILNLKLTLQIGSVGESIVITGEVPLIQTSSSAVQSSVTVRQMQDLPLNGRNPLQLVTLTAGAQTTDSGTVIGQQDNRGLSVNGLRSTQNNFRLDGANYNNRFFGSAPVLPNPDTLEEFTVQSANYSARTSGAGAVIELSTRSGSNQFHGSGFEFLRNTELNARNYFAARRPPFKLNQYGGTFGGPVKQDKTFFFFSYQGTKQRSAPGTTVITTPSQAQRNGDFSSLLSLANPIKIIDPLNGGAPFAGNIIPSSRIDALSLKVAAQYLPLPNLPNGNYTTAQNRNVDDDQILVKIDQIITANNRLSGRYYQDDNDFQRPFNAPLGFYAANDFKNKSLTLRDTHVFSPNFTLTASGGWYRFGRKQEPQAPGKQTVQALGANAPLGTNVTGIFPGVRVNLSGFVNIFSGGALEQLPSGFDFHVAATYVLGRHTIQFGTDVVRDTDETNDYSFTPGTWTFNGQRSGYVISDFILGLPSNFTQDSGRQNLLHETKAHFWVQDDWKFSKNLTLNLGLRWEPWLPPTDDRHNLVGFIPGVQSTVAPNAPVGIVFPGDKGIPDSLFKKDYMNFGPRVGFAWDVTGQAKWVVRAGYGIFFIDPALTIYTRTVSTQPSVLTSNFNNPQSFENPFGNIAGGSPFPRTRISPSAFSTYPFILPVSGGGLDPATKTGYSQNWNITIDRQLPWDMAVSAAYIGNHGVRIIAARELNPGIYGPGATTGNTQSRRAYVGVGAFEYASPWQWSRFNSLQLNWNKRTNNGLSVFANYVYSKAIDNGSSTVEGGLSYPRNPNNINSNKGLADFDVRHRFNLSGVYDTPQLKTENKFLSVIANDWQINTILNIQTGLPFTVYSGTDRSLSGVGADFADQVGNPARLPGFDSVSQFFNPAAFAPAALGTFGNIGRNSLTGPGRAEIDAAIFKNFVLFERFRLQFRAEVFNLQNRANFLINYNQNPNGTPSPTILRNNPNFGRLVAADDPRVFQFGMKFLF